MQEFFGFTDEQFSKLLKKKVTVADLFKTAKIFDPYDAIEEANPTSLLYYIDSKGSFNKPPFLPHKKVAKAYFDSLKIKDKIAVAEYEELWENKYVEADDDE